MLIVRFYVYDKSFESTCTSLLFFSPATFCVVDGATALPVRIGFEKNLVEELVETEFIISHKKCALSCIFAHCSKHSRKTHLRDCGKNKYFTVYKYTALGVVIMKRLGLLAYACFVFALITSKVDGAQSIYQVFVGNTGTRALYFEPTPEMHEKLSFEASHQTSHHTQDKLPTYVFKMAVVPNQGGTNETFVKFNIDNEYAHISISHVDDITPFLVANVSFFAGGIHRYTRLCTSISSYPFAPFNMHMRLDADNCIEIFCLRVCDGQQRQLDNVQVSGQLFVLHKVTRHPTAIRGGQTNIDSVWNFEEDYSMQCVRGVKARVSEQFSHAASINLLTRFHHHLLKYTPPWASNGKGTNLGIFRHNSNIMSEGAITFANDELAAFEHDKMFRHACVKRDEVSTVKINVGGKNGMDTTEHTGPVTTTPLPPEESTTAVPTTPAPTTPSPPEESTTPVPTTPSPPEESTTPTPTTPSPSEESTTPVPTTPSPPEESTTPVPTTPSPPEESTTPAPTTPPPPEESTTPPPTTPLPPEESTTLAPATPSPPDQNPTSVPTIFHWYVGMNITIILDENTYDHVSADIEDYFLSIKSNIQIQINVLQRNVASRRLLALFEYILYLRIGGEGQSRDEALELQSLISNNIQNGTFLANFNVTNFTQVIIFSLPQTGVLRTQNEETEVRNTTKNLTIFIIVGVATGVACCVCCFADFPETTKKDPYMSDDDDDFDYEQDHMKGSAYVVGQLYPSISFSTHVQPYSSNLYIPQTIIPVNYVD